MGNNGEDFLAVKLQGWLTAAVQVGLQASIAIQINKLPGLILACIGSAFIGYVGAMPIMAVPLLGAMAGMALKFSHVRRQC